MSDGWPPVLERGVAGLAHAGEGRSGDLAVFVTASDGGVAIKVLYAPQVCGGYFPTPGA